MWGLSTGLALGSVIALGSKYIREQHVRTSAGRARALKALSAPLRSPRASFRWIKFLRSNAFAQNMLHREPDFAVKPLLRYLNSTYQFADRVRALVSHYEFVTRQFSEGDLASIYFGPGLALAQFTGKSGISYRVILGTYSPCHNEGEMVLKIETSGGDVICLAIFSIGSSADGTPRIELGSIQGAPKHVDASVTKVATRDFHSTRPKHLLMATLGAFAHSCKIDSIVCVSTRTQINYRNGSNDFFHAHYDALWEELGGHWDGSRFYVLTLPISLRNGAKEAATHRSRHRRRIELKAGISEMLQDSLVRALPLGGSRGAV
jgi:uncharacterized protein